MLEHALVTLTFLIPAVTLYLLLAHEVADRGLVFASKAQNFIALGAIFTVSSAASMVIVPVVSKEQTVAVSPVEIAMPEPKVLTVKEARGLILVNKYKAQGELISKRIRRLHTQDAGEIQDVTTAYYNMKQDELRMKTTIGLHAKRRAAVQSYIGTVAVFNELNKD
jgi:hypothetical protein